MRPAIRIAERCLAALATVLALQGCGTYPNASIGPPLAYDDGDPKVLQVRKQGFALRAAIDACYSERGCATRTKSSDWDVTPVVRTFIPVGMPMADAESVLAFAGLTVSARPGKEDHYPRVNARIPDYVSTFPSTQLGISLYPTGRFEKVDDPAAVDWSTVRGLSASIYVVWPLIR